MHMFSCMLRCQIHDQLPHVKQARLQEEEAKKRRRAAGGRVLVAHDPALMHRGRGGGGQRGRRGSVLGGKALVEELDTTGEKQGESRAAGGVWKP